MNSPLCITPEGYLSHRVGPFYQIVGIYEFDEYMELLWLTAENQII